MEQEKQALMQRAQDMIPAREQVMQLLQNPNVATPLLAAAGGGLVGGVISGRSPRHPGETRAQKRRRVLRDALLSAGVTGGATALTGYGYNQLNTALPSDVPNPAAEGLKGLGRAGLGIGGGAWAGKLHNRTRQELAALTLKEQAQTVSNNPISQLKALLTDPAKSRAADQVRANTARLRQLGVGRDGTAIGAWGLEGERIAELASGAKNRFVSQVKNAPGLRGKAMGMRGMVGAGLRHGKNFALRHPALSTASLVAATAPTVWDHVLRPIGETMVPPIATFE